MRRTVGMIAAMAVLAVALAGCSSSGTGGAAAPSSSQAAATPGATASAAGVGQSSPTAAAAATITVRNFGYSVSGPVRAAQKVTVTNKDSASHTVTADTGKAFDVNVPGGSTVTFTAPSKPGRYTFHCAYHANMHGTIDVR